MESLREINAANVQLSRLQEKEELQRLNDRFSSYVARVRNLGQQSNNVDSLAFVHSTKILEEEIINLKNMYQIELDRLRNEIETGAHERSSLFAQSNKQHKYIGELQDRIMIETDKNNRLLDEINILQRKIGNLEAEVQDTHIAAQRPQDMLNELQISVENLTEEVNQWKYRFEQEQLASQRSEERLHLITKKVEFSEQVQDQQIKDYQSRLDTAAATVLSLEAYVRELTTTDTSANEMVKQIRDSAEAELRKYQIESEEQYSRNLCALKAQMDCDADRIYKFSQEKSELVGRVGELQAKILNLEGQMANLHHQKMTLEDTMTMERNRATENSLQLEKKLRDVQDMLVTKMFEVTSVRDSNIPLKAEIEALKTLLAEEEKRIQVPLQNSMPSSGAHTSILYLPTTSEIMNTSSLSALKAATSNHLQSSSVQNMINNKRSSISGVIGPLTHYDLYPNLSTSYIPEFVNHGDESKLMYNTNYDQGLSEYDLYKHEVFQPMTRSQYYYEASPSISRLHVDPSFSATPRALGPIQARASSAPVKTDSHEDTQKLSEKKGKDRKWNYIPSDFGCGRDYFEKMFGDLQKNSPFSNSRPKSSPSVRQTPASFHNNSVSTSSAIGDLKILEVDQDGKYVQLVNEGSRELQIGEYIIRQNVDGYPVAVFRFPPNIKFPPNATVTVWSAMNDPELHNPPSDFYWNDQEKWGTGPEYSTILCRSNGQAVAWTTAAHRYFKEAQDDAVRSKPELYEEDDIKDLGNDINDAENVENNRNTLGHKSELNNLRRQKQQPPLLVNSKHSHGNNPVSTLHPQTRQQLEIDSSLCSNHKSRTQTAQTAQNGVGTSVRAMTNGLKQQHPPTIRGNGTLANKQAGIIHTNESSPYTSSMQEHHINEI